MDAKVGDWVVTPRRGKAVEINALFYNALMLLARWLEQHRPGDDPAPAATLRAEVVRAHADRLRASFNRRFWNEATGCLFDVVDGEGAARDDASIRPNQVLAISLPHPVLDAGALARRHARRPRAAGDARSGCARWRPGIPTTSAATTAICARATPPTTRGRSGAG